MSSLVVHGIDHRVEIAQLQLVLLLPLFCGVNPSADHQVTNDCLVGTSQQQMRVRRMGLTWI
jgi:hypothetical protein